MVAYGFEGLALDEELRLATSFGATVLEIFPEWKSEPDPRWLHSRIADSGFSIHSAHGCWGGQTIRANRVDLGRPDSRIRQESLDDLRRCIDWLSEAGGTCLVVHPGGLSAPEDAEVRRGVLASGLAVLGDHARGSGVVVCVENMPPGVYPGSRMADLAGLVAELGHDRIALALDTGHAHISLDPATETRAAGRWLRTTHVHDNDGRQDTHHPPGLGTIDWDAWATSLDEVGYEGPIMLECIRYLRKDPASARKDLLDRLCRIDKA